MRIEPTEGIKVKFKLGIIGAGVMGQAILKSIAEKKLLAPSNISVFDLSKEKTETLKENGFSVCSSAKELVAESEYILIAVKPQHFDSLAEEIKLSEKNTVISIMAGIKTSTLSAKLGKTIGIARVMPNTPCQIGKGVCAVVYKNLNEEKQSFVKQLLSCCGEVVDVEEQYFDAVTSVSGSGPAYVYMFIDGMIKGGIDGGLSYEQSKKLAVNTVIGAALLSLSSDDLPEILTEKVCSKGGTTIEAVKVYREKGLETLIREGISACRKRSEEMSKSI